MRSAGKFKRKKGSSKSVSTKAHAIKVGVSFITSSVVIRYRKLLKVQELASWEIPKNYFFVFTIEEENHKNKKKLIKKWERKSRSNWKALQTSQTKKSHKKRGRKNLSFIEIFKWNFVEFVWAWKEKIEFHLSLLWRLEREAPSLTRVINLEKEREHPVLLWYPSKYVLIKHERGVVSTIGRYEKLTPLKLHAHDDDNKRRIVSWKQIEETKNFMNRRDNDQAMRYKPTNSS